MKWINVKDGVPEPIHESESDSVIFYRKEFFVATGFYCHEAKKWYNENGFCIDGSDKVTHWMPLPEPPED